MNLRIVIACLILGVLTEGLAYWQKLWIYDPWWLRVVGIVVVYGLLFGWLSTAVGSYPAGWRFAAGALAGVLYEGSNLLWLHLFTFPNGRLLFLRSPTAIILGAGIPWGLAPLLTPLFRAS